MAGGGRPRSPMRVITERGREAGGVVLTDLDLARINRLARWYCVPAEYLVRAETDPALWHPDLAPTPEQADDMGRRVYGAKRRLGKLVRIADNGTHVGAPVGSAELGNRLTGWFATSYGGTAAGAPWRLTGSISPVIGRHAFAAADVGLQLETLRIAGDDSPGFRVLSEREIRTRVDQFGDDVIPDIESQFRTDNGTIRKSPDLAVMDAAGENYIAVEVERDTRRPLKSYRDKLTAYENNPRVLAVWYLCDQPGVMKRVGRAATQVFGQNSGFPLRIRGLVHHPAFVEIPNLSRDANLLADLARITGGK